LHLPPPPFFFSSFFFIIILLFSLFLFIFFLFPPTSHLSRPSTPSCVHAPSSPTYSTHMFTCNSHAINSHLHLQPILQLKGTPLHVSCFKKNICWRIFKFPNNVIRDSSTPIAKELKEFKTPCFLLFLFF
jgi:hypothetical protein